MLYLISIPSPGASVISLESILYRPGCAMNVPLTVGASPLADGSSTGAIDATSPAAAGVSVAALAGAGSVALARSVRPRALACSERVDPVFRREDDE